MAEKKITGYSLFIYFPLRRVVDVILIFFTRILTIDRCYSCFHKIFLISLCFDFDFILPPLLNSILALLYRHQ